MKHYYFAYGANTNLDSMAARCPGAKPIGPAILYDFRLVFRTHCDVEYDSSNQVIGVLWEIDDDNLYSLDIFEGYPKYYYRDKISVYDQNDREFEAWIYYMNTQDYVFPPNQSYFNLVYEGYQQNGVPSNQLEKALNESYVYQT